MKNKIIIGDKEFEFVDVVDDEFRSTMKLSTPHSTIDDYWEIVREYDCDSDAEKWTLVHFYISVRNSVSKPDYSTREVYHGVTLRDSEFRANLLEHILKGFGFL